MTLHSIQSTAPGERVQNEVEPASADTESGDARRGWQSAFIDDLTAASDLLDCLENQGVREAELVVLNEVSFVVRWRLDVLTALTSTG